MRLQSALVVASVAGAILLGCESSTGDCAGEGVPSVRADITDSVTGAPLAYRSSLVIRDGLFVDSVPYQYRQVDSATFGYIEAGNDREGTYSVTVRREGSRAWTRNGVRVSRNNGCNLKQAVLTVRLQPAS